MSDMTEALADALGERLAPTNQSASRPIAGRRPATKARPAASPPLSRNACQVALRGPGYLRFLPLGCGAYAPFPCRTSARAASASPRRSTLKSLPASWL